MASLSSVAVAATYDHSDMHAHKAGSLFSTSMGLAYEERSTSNNIYIFLSQVIHSHWYWELRGYAVRSIISAYPALKPGNFIWQPNVPQIPNFIADPNVVDNQWGGGIVGKLGYIFKPNHRVSLTPYLRLQYFRNNTAQWKDDLGNEIETEIASYLAGLKLAMDVNEIFTIYVDYFGGYQRVEYEVSGFFAQVNDDLNTIQLTNTFEIGSPFKLNKCWTFIPYIQFGLTTSKPSFNVFNGPINNNGTTTNTTVFAAKIAYKWS
jgi:hypothetical protein